MLLLLPACKGEYGTGGGGAGPLDPDDPDVSSVQLRRLTRHELTNTLRTLVPQVEPNPELIRQLPEDSNAVFDNDAALQAPSELLVAGLNTLAEDTAARLVANTARREELLGCTPTGADDAACYKAFVASFGRRVLRRPLTPDEVDAFAAAFLPLAAEDGDFYAAVEPTVAALLQDLEFAYRIEVGSPIPGVSTHVALSGFEVATRMSYLLWGTCPDDALLDAAAEGKLATPQGRGELATAMLADPRAATQISRFHAMWLGYERSLPATSSIPAAIRDKMRAEADALFRRVVLEDRASWFDVLSATESYLDDELATYYGDVPLPGSSTAAWAPLGDSRAGLLSLGAFLNVGTKFSDTSPTQRGLSIRRRLLCGDVPLPGPDLMQSLDEVPPSPTGCKLDGYRALIADPGCASCHTQMDTIGLGLERYDLGGRFRTHEPEREDCLIDGAGTLPLASGDAAFNGPAELAGLLLDNREFETCVVTQVYRFAQGRFDTSLDGQAIERLTTAFRAGGTRLDALLLELVTTPSFAHRALTR